jgi:hypothetical protein
MSTELKAPEGKIRIVGVDLFSSEDYLVGDYDDQDQAFRVADEHNSERSGSMSDVYYGYNDQGRYVRGSENVKGPGVSP